tara:strand:+ start:363 stop:1499 length:1137 start_codon:yes stop_codon:yes gene_type:complete
MNKKIRILFSTGVFPPLIGGPAKIVERLTQELTNRDYTCTVLTFGAQDNVDRGYAITRIPFSIPQPLRFFILLIKTFILSAKSDIIYATDTYSNGLSSAIAAKLLNKPLILRFTGDSAWEHAFNSGSTNKDIVSFQKEQHTLSTKLRIARRNFILKASKKIITDCKFLKNLLISIGISENKITIINNAVEISTVTADKSDTNNILTIGRLIPWKGIDTLISIMPQVKKQIPNAKLCIAGTGPEEENLKNLAQIKGLSDSVTFLGGLSDKKEKNKLYSSYNVFVLNTFYEGMSNTLLEAMASALPIVTTRSGGSTEFVNQDNGILVEYNNHYQLTRAIITLLSNKDRADNLGQNAQKSVSQFTWENLVNKNIAVIESLI